MFSWRFVFLLHWIIYCFVVDGVLVCFGFCCCCCFLHHQNGWATQFYALCHVSIICSVIYVKLLSVHLSHLKLSWSWGGKNSNNRWTIRVTFWTPLGHTRNRGRPRTRWRDDLDSVIKTLPLCCKKRWGQWGRLRATGDYNGRNWQLTNLLLIRFLYFVREGLLF